MTGQPTCFLGIDVGTTSTQAILIAEPDRVLALASRATTLSAPQPGWAEQDPREWWRNACELVPELLTAAGLRADAIAGIGVTGMLPAVVLLDARGQLLRAAIQQSDGRCGEEVRELLTEYSPPAFVTRTGNGINQQLVAAKLRWLEKHEPAIFARIATVFGSYDYLNWQLTGQRAVDRNWALEAGFMDLATLQLSPDLIALAHVAPACIPGLQASHQLLGRVSETAARASGLRAGTPVVGGSADHIASAYVAGISKPGDVLLKFGGSADILVASERAAPDPRLFLDLHLMPGLYVPNGCMASGGSALNWFVATLGTDLVAAAAAAGCTPHALLDTAAAATPAGADGVQLIPYFLGEKTPIHDPQARAIIHGLSLSHDRRHLWRALLEGFGYAFRHHVEVLNDMGHPTTHFLASDGGSRSTLWMQICADILATPVQLLRGHPGSCLGAAWMAALGTGHTSDWAGPARFVSLGDRIAPNPGNRSTYDAGYRRFRATYESLAPTSTR